MKMRDSLRSAGLMGRGGQGIVYAVSILAKTLFEEGYYVAQLQSYGAEVRGGSVFAYVVYGRNRIINPFVERLDHLVLLSDVKLDEWKNIISRSRLVLADHVLVREPPANALVAPFSKELIEARLIGKESMAALGCLAALGVVDLGMLEDTVPKGADRERNLSAIRVGYRICASEALGKVSP